MSEPSAGPWRPEPEVPGMTYKQTHILAGSAPAEVIGVAYGGPASRANAQLFGAGRVMRTALQACEVHLLREIHEYIGCVTTPDGHVIVDLDAEYLGATCSLLAQVGAALAQAEGRTP
ncbi:MAG: hypothetical protein H7A12_16495 [Pseudomonadales bacterium]|nr:hypothetical protein [Pseudomonadales bacterium]